MIVWLTQNGVHDDQCNIVFDIELALIAFLLQIVDALHDTFVEDWNVAVQDWQTERRI